MNDLQDISNTHLDSRAKLQLELPVACEDDRFLSESHNQCTICNKTFITTRNLKRHHKGVHERVTYPCTVCYKTFSQAGNLKTHIREQHEGKISEYECRECEKVFHRKGNLKEH